MPPKMTLLEAFPCGILDDFKTFVCLWFLLWLEINAGFPAAKSRCCFFKCLLGSYIECRNDPQSLTTLSRKYLCRNDHQSLSRKYLLNLNKTDGIKLI